MSKLVYDICYFDTYCEHKIVLHESVPDMASAVLLWEKESDALAGNLTLKPYILPRRVS